MAQKNAWIQKFFRFEARNTDMTTECKAGITAAIISMFALLGSMQIIMKVTGMGEGQILIPLITITLLFSALLTIGAGIYSRLPLLFISTIGFNTFISVNIVQGISKDWGLALAIITVESLIFIILAFTKIPNLFFKDMPEYFKKAAPMAMGGILVFYALIAGKVVHFQGSEVTAWTLRIPEVLLFSFGFIATYFLVKEKSGFSYVQGFLLTLLTGMFIPKALPENLTTAAVSFWAPFWIIVGFLIAWMMIYAYFVDKHSKKALENSIWIILFLMLIALVFYTNPEAIISKPLKLTTNSGIFGLPSFKNITGIVGYPIYNLKAFFKEFPKFFVPLLSLLVVHWMSYMALLAIINGYVHIRKADTKAHFEKKAVISEGTFGLLGSASGTGFISSLYGTIFSVLAGAKTGFSSIISGLMFLVFLFLIPLINKTFLPYTVAPVIAVFGFRLILDFLPTTLEKKIDWIPVLVTLIIGMASMNLFHGISGGLLAFVIVKASHKELKEISTLTWVLVCLFIVWSFFRIVIPTINLVG